MASLGRCRRRCPCCHLSGCLTSGTIPCLVQLPVSTSPECRCFLPLTLLQTT
uniref:Uncharacterized protein n=1 Tax=Arundo donax TaxID=35708 RepID=A0A0A9G1D5_ARUDO